MSEKWEGSHWSVSPHNFASEIDVVPHEVVLHDITLRDGEECADVALGIEEKVVIAEALAGVGIKRLELFLTVPGSLEVAKRILSRNLPMSLYVTWEPGRVERALDAGVGHVMVWYRASDQYQKHVFTCERAEYLDNTMRTVARAKEHWGAHVNLFMPESTRMTLAQLKETVEVARNAGADAVTLVDSLSITRPATMRFLVAKIREWTGLPVEVHCHNDFGLAVANVLAAYEGGATSLHVAANALGYRAGNAALEEVAVALEVLYGVNTGLKLERLPWLSDLVARLTGIPIAYFKAVVGGGAFRYEQWRATAALETAGLRKVAFPYEPEMVGRTPTLVVGKWSDVGAIERKLVDLGLTASAQQVQAIFGHAVTAGLAHRRPLREDEFLEIALKHGALTER